MRTSIFVHFIIKITFPAEIVACGPDRGEGPNSSTRLIMAVVVEEASRALKTKTYIDETHQSVFVTLPTMRKEEVQQRMQKDGFNIDIHLVDINNSIL